MRHLILMIAAASGLIACSGPKDTPLPREISKMETIQPAMQKLAEDERTLVAGYIMRHTMGAALGGLFGGKPGPGIPEGMTLGKAIEEQRSFLAAAAAEEAKQKALKEKLAAERLAAIKPMQEAVTVTLVSKKLQPEYGYGGTLMDEHIKVVFGYKNNTAKDIAGVKGTILIKDLFGDQLSAFAVSNDTTIKAGESLTWSGSRSVKFSLRQNQDRKLAELTEDKYKVEWAPEMVVFKDGSKLTVPE